MLFITTTSRWSGDRRLRRGDARRRDPEKGTADRYSGAAGRPRARCCCAGPQRRRRPKRLPSSKISEFRGPVKCPSAARIARRRRDCPRVRHLGKSFYSRERLFEEGVQGGCGRLLQARQGETLGVVGESGSGKTTVALTLMRLHGPRAGSPVRRKEPAGLSHQDDAIQAAHQIVFQNPTPRSTRASPSASCSWSRCRSSHRGERANVATGSTNCSRSGCRTCRSSEYPRVLRRPGQRIAIARCLTMSRTFSSRRGGVRARRFGQAQVLNLLQDLQDGTTT